MKRYAAAFAMILVLAGCSGGDIEGGQQALDAEASANAEGDGPKTTVDAAETAEWENGLNAKITAATAAPVEGSDYTERGHDTEVTITVELSNDGSAPFVFSDSYQGPNGPRDTLYYGENLYEAQEWANPGKGMDALPKQLVPGTSATFTGVWSLPAEGLQSLTYEFTPDHGNLLQYTFTGVEKLIA